MCFSQESNLDSYKVQQSCCTLQSVKSDKKNARSKFDLDVHSVANIIGRMARVEPQERAFCSHLKGLYGSQI